MPAINLTCGDLAEAIDFYTEELGFRIDRIFPADAPRRAALSGHGLQLTMRQRSESGADDVPATAPSIVIAKVSEQGFGTGRAGMQYRDLIPGRFGGRFIASHIRIPDGGPVPDYVHHHDIAFQLIFCVNGWVRVVYEDQGEPMLMQAGDCFLQPPHIRHRVLECSDRMEVVEIASPAEHETFVDHEMRLPTRHVDADRDFGGQTFVFHQAGKANWLSADLPGLEYRNTGIAAATRGKVSAVVVRATDGCPQMPLRHGAGLRFMFVLRGQATFEHDASTTLAARDALALPAGVDCRLTDLSVGFEYLEVIVPEKA